ncbi:MAG: proprotein convertase P-domain-containing protein, partial [Planctomycetes bacterium]|nr:proprotein convertase P-domain-containing protein [Planctomycetota bacterium]
MQAAARTIPFIAGVLFFTLPAGAQVDSLEECALPDITFGGSGLPGTIEAIASSVEFTDDLEIGDTRVFTDITHTFIGDLAIFVTSPAGTAVTLFFDTTGALADENILVTWSEAGIDFGPPFDCDCSMQPLQPSLSNYDCESALGTWTLDVLDLFPASDEGTLNEWCVEVSTRAPAATCATPAASFGGAGLPASLASIIEIGEDRFADGVEISAAIDHAAPNEMVIAVTSPLGATVTLHESDADALPGIALTWSSAGIPNAPPFDCLCLMLPAGPGTMEDLALASAQGDWTLEIEDSVAASTPGTLDEWCVLVYGAPTPRKPDALVCSAPAAAFGLDPLPASVADTISIKDELPGFFDLEVSTDITHTFAGDVAVEVTSPAATTVTLLAADEAGDDDDVLTTWSDLGEPHAPPFACGLLMEPLDAAGMAGLITKSFAGDWTITVSDAFLGSDSGVLEEWCLRAFAETIVPTEPLFLRGDADGNGLVQALLDALALLNWQFNAGAEPPCFDAADVDGNSAVNALIDALY